ncbi:hypothetical protein BIT28_22505 [Photobacterium proteolyticum]|uniref:Cytochrome c-type protein n=1 Tax=Photobacterium proteolyticum TaxID=1903952 RepID=A0A1Q9GLH8_9GAMM|nr:NapC/NirT family cytochrome c [Photobacterium proteolyticum]OLQ75415.1 hypothetical protein BIT28_22505 [Photobacterium proteolyticum]
MKKPLRKITWGSLIIGFALGVFLVPATITFNHFTSTEDFCGNSCHAMSWVINDPSYINSSHRKNGSGVVATCKDCHLPNDLLRETWAHIRDGSRDLIASLSNDFSEKQTWEARRQALTYEVRKKMIADNSESCSSCHQLAFLENTKERVGRQHELANRNNVKCIQCHFNLVHSPVKPSVFDREDLKLLPNYERVSVAPANQQ